MRIVAHDPYVTSKIAQDLGAELLPLADLYLCEPQPGDHRRAGRQRDPTERQPPPLEPALRGRLGLRGNGIVDGVHVVEVRLRAFPESAHVLGDRALHGGDPRRDGVQRLGDRVEVLGDVLQVFRHRSANDVEDGDHVGAWMLDCTPRCAPPRRQRTDTAAGNAG